jgi:ABC-type Na+ efflux pump permease subunit
MTTSDKLKELFAALSTTNPMMAEVKRVNRKLFNVGNWKAGMTAGVILVGIIYLFFLGMIARFYDAIEAKWMLFALMAIMFIVIPVNLNGVISTEHEKRSFEMLLVAPLTPSQIAAAKLLRGAGAFLLTVGLLLVPAIWLLIVQAIKVTSMTGYNQVHPVFGLISGLCVVVSASVLSASVSVYISSRTRTIAASMASALGLHFVALVLVPVILGISGMKQVASIVTFPFTTLGIAFGDVTDLSGTVVGPYSVWLVSIPFWLGLAVVFMYMTAEQIRRSARGETGRRRLTKGEGENA